MSSGGNNERRRADDKIEKNEVADFIEVVFRFWPILNRNSPLEMRKSAKENIRKYHSHDQTQREHNVDRNFEFSKTTHFAKDSP